MLKLSPTFEKPCVNAVPEQEPSPVRVERHGCDRLRHPLRAQGRECSLRALDPLTRSVSDGVVDELRVGARRERWIFWFGRNCILQVLDRARPGATDPVKVAEEEFCLGPQARGTGGRGLARDLARATKVASREEHFCLP